ncbi:MAG TPA: O-acetyl-ADP-ribose deacetylase [Bacteroidia bacterium]|nr:O-acetyl-ADP-ribose deacetylase [Bacteroidia bacterium]
MAALKDRMKLVRADITKMEVDAIVNAANTSLLGGGGVDGAIHRAAGPELLEACKKLNGCNTGSAKFTEGYRLPAKFVIHAVGPIWSGGNTGEVDLLTACYRNSLLFAPKLSLRTIAFPCISTGAYHFPPEHGANIATSAVAEFLSGNKLPEVVWFVVFNEEDKKIYEHLLSLLPKE